MTSVTLANLLNTRASIIMNISRCMTYTGNEEIYNSSNAVLLNQHLAEVNTSIIAAELGIDRTKFTPSYFNDDGSMVILFITNCVNNFNNIILPYFGLGNPTIPHLVKEYYNMNYKLLPNKEEIDNKIQTFKLTCNIPDEYVFFLMNIHSAIEDIIESVCDSLCNSGILYSCFPFTNLVLYDTDSKNPSGEVDSVVRLWIQSKTKKMYGDIQSYIMNSIMATYRQSILDTTPIYQYLGSLA